MDEHPSELLVLWMSKHGSECNTGQDQYPGSPHSLLACLSSKMQRSRPIVSAAVLECQHCSIRHMVCDMKVLKYSLCQL